MFEDTLLDSDQTLLPNNPSAMRGKYFVFTKNVTAAQSIEVGLERFGIMIDSGNRLTKRRVCSFVTTHWRSFVYVARISAL